ncbi:bifunctional tRNA (5-methylaminomethyl-2-thiouridine)(34)-methyltransferase MnmD/FAD-dependent 5-carboxymethylaminomethyl-2-thiouridine(34) oxidoreductase MnmC [soil metagenome]
MKTAPITPAQIDFSDPAAPLAVAFGDVFHSRAGALAQARHVFLGGNGLPGRWAGRPRFVILETGFGLGNNFLASWAAWAADPERCERLVFISIEKHPLQTADLQRAHASSELPKLAAQLLAAWPPLTPNLHQLSFEAGRVQLLLCLGDVHLWLRELVAEVDAFYLDGFSPAVNPAMWDRHALKALARHAAPDATAASWSVAPEVRAGLLAAGFPNERQRGFANKGGMCVARFAPHHAPHRPIGREPLAPDAREALILGAGLAGAACAWALSQQGIACTVLDSRPGPAQASSGNPAGLFHGTLNPDDGTHARFNRAAALATERVLRELPELPGLQRGLLRLELTRTPAQMRALIARLGLPAAYVQALDAAGAAAASGLDHLRHPAWFYPGGGALSPATYVSALLAASGAQLHSNTAVDRIERRGDQWQALAADGRLLGQAPLLVLAGGHEASRLLQDLAPGLPLTTQRGQLTHLDRIEGSPHLPVAGLGYALSDQAGGMWCGATSQDGDMDPRLREADQAQNIAQWARLSDTAVPAGHPLAGRVAWRLSTPDRLPLVGGLPIDGAGHDQPRFIARQPGLAVCTALGSRGITWAALCAQVLAAQVTGAPLPLEASLLDAIDPARFAVRELRKRR